MSSVHWRGKLRRELAAAQGPFDHVRPLLQRMRAASQPFGLLHLRTIGPTVAFSRRDELQPGFAAARAAAEAAGFAAAVRPVGGTFAPLHTGSLIVDEYGYRPGAAYRSIERYEAHGAILQRALTALGVDARLGPVAGEYCPGDYSVNAGGRVKIAGTAQRASGDAWLVSTVIQVASPEPLRAVTEACAAALGQDLDSSVIGSLDGEVDAIGLGELARRVAAEFRASGVGGRAGVLGVTLE